MFILAPTSKLYKRFGLKGDIDRNLLLTYFYPQVAESIQESIEEIKNKQEDIQRMKSDLGLAGDNDAESALSNLR